MKFDTFGLVALLLSIVILMALLTRTTEHFTSAAGTYPAWSSIVKDVKSVLDQQYTYSFSDYLSYADEEVFMQNPTTQSQLGLIQQLYPIDSEINADTFAESFPKETYIATQPYSMMIKFLELMRSQLVGYINKPTKDKDPIQNVTELRQTEGAAVALRTMAYQYLLSYPGSAKPPVKDKKDK